MKIKLLAGVLSLFFVFTTNVLAQSFDWAFKSGINNYGNLGDIITDHSNNILITGNFIGACDFDPGINNFNVTNTTGYDFADAFIAKYTSSGLFINAIKLGGVNLDQGMALKVTGNNSVIVTGNFSDTVDFDPGPGVSMQYADSWYASEFILKLDSNLNFVWVKALHPFNPTYFPFNIIRTTITSNEDIFITGTFYGTVDFNPGAAIDSATSLTDSQFILRLDSNGDFSWVKFIHGTVAPFSICADGQFNIYIAGGFLASADFDPGPGISILSVDTNSQWSDNDGFISKYDSSGNFIWAKNIGGKKNDAIHSVILNNQTLLMAGIFKDTVDFDPNLGIFYMQAGIDTSSNYFAYDSFILELDTGGNFIWVKQFKTIPTPPDYGSNGSTSIVMDSNGFINVAGWRDKGDSIDFDPGASTYYLYPNTIYGGSYLARLDNNGNFKSALITRDSIGIINFSKIIQGFNGRLVLYGQFYGTCDFDFGPGNFFMTEDSANFYPNFFVLSLADTLTSIKENYYSDKLNIYPNPSDESITITSDFKPGDEIHLTDALGKILYRKKLAAPVVNYQLSTVNFQNGIYFLSVQTGTEKMTRKMVVNH